jgi:hypothetical protein
VLDVWNERRSEAVRARRLLDDKIAGVRRRKDVLHDRYLEGKVHQADYEQQNARLAKDVALASIERDRLADDGSAFGTAKTSPVFSYLRSVSDTESKMASPMMPSWNHAVGVLTDW